MKCIFKPVTTHLRVVSKKLIGYGEKFEVLAQDNQNPLAGFTYWESGFISDLFVNKKLRRKKEGLNILFKIKDFVIKRTKEKKLDYIDFYSKPKKTKNLDKLFKHLGAEVLEYNPKGSRFIVIVNPRKKETIRHNLQLYSDYNVSELLPLLSSIFSFCKTNLIKFFKKLTLTN